MSTPTSVVPGNMSGLEMPDIDVWSDRDVIRSLVGLAEEAGCNALVVTVDLPVIGKRERDLRNGLSIPPQITLQSVRDVLQHPSWLWDFLRSPPVIYKNFEGLAEGSGFVAKGVGLRGDPSVVQPAMVQTAYIRSSPLSSR